MHQVVLVHGRSDSTIPFIDVGNYNTTYNYMTRESNSCCNLSNNGNGRSYNQVEQNAYNNQSRNNPKQAMGLSSNNGPHLVNMRQQENAGSMSVPGITGAAAFSNNINEATSGGRVGHNVHSINMQEQNNYGTPPRKRRRVMSHFTSGFSTDQECCIMYFFPLIVVYSQLLYNLLKCQQVF